MIVCIQGEPEFQNFSTEDNCKTFSIENAHKRYNKVSKCFPVFCTYQLVPLLSDDDSM